MKTSSKLSLLTLLVFLVSYSISHSQVVVLTLSGTIDNTLAGYNAGQNFSFSFTVTDDNVGNSINYNNFSTRLNQWYYGWEGTYGAQGPVFSGLSGTGISGSYTSTYSDYKDPLEYTSFYDSKVFISIDRENSAYLPGVNANGFSIKSIGSTVFTYAFKDRNNDTTDPGALSWLSSVEGTYDVSTISGYSYMNTSVGYVYFSPTTLEISTTAVPEPSTYATVLGILTLGVLVYRKKMKSSK